MSKWLWFCLSALIIVCDQVSKFYAVKLLSLYEPVAVFPGFDLLLAYNAGAAFSFLSESGGWQRWFFSGFSLMMAGILTLWILRTSKKETLRLASFALILGGAIGNAIDRIRLGYVIDFIDLHYQTYHWPVFNIADVAVCFGAFLLLLETVKK